MRCFQHTGKTAGLLDFFQEIRRFSGRPGNKIIPADDQAGRPLKTHGGKQLALPDFVDAKCRRKNPAAGIGNSQPFQHTLYAAVFAIRSVQGEKGKINQTGQLRKINGLPGLIAQISQKCIIAVAQ